MKEMGRRRRLPELRRRWKTTAGNEKEKEDEGRKYGRQKDSQKM
jgi:hypothetical protein